MDVSILVVLGKRRRAEGGFLGADRHNLESVQKEASYEKSWYTITIWSSCEK